MNPIAEIKEFFNISVEKLHSLPITLLCQMVAAVNDDNYLALHNLGYVINYDK